MSGTLTIPNVFANAVGNQPGANLDADLSGIAAYVNIRELTVGLLANRPAAGFNGRSYFATDVSGGTLYLDDGSTWRSVSATPVTRSYLAGLTLSNDSGSPNTVLDIAAGLATSDDQTTAMTLAAFTKSTSAWVVGTGNGGNLEAVAIANNTWYHVYVIERTDTGVVDAGFSTSASAPTLPSGYTKKRRIGSFKTATGTTNILAFTQDGDLFQWAASILDVNANNPGTSAVLRTLTVPLGVNVVARVNAHITASGATGGTGYLSDPAVTDEAASSTVAPLSSIGDANNAVSLAVGPLLVRTNTSSQIRSRLLQSDAGNTLAIATLGWLDSRGRNA